MGRSSGGRSLAPFATAPVLVSAGATFAVLLGYAGRYGYHRDELYFVSSADRLAWGFVDQPPLTPAIARVSEALAPGSLVALRTWPALFIAAAVVVTALCARELGAGRRGQAAVAVAVAASPGMLAAGHLLSTSTLDITLWTATTFLVLRLLRTGDQRLWLPVGGLVGVGLLNKWTIGFLVVGLLVGIVAGPERRLLASRWFGLGAVLALVLWAPNLLWQANHDWPQIDMIFDIQEGASDAGATIAWLPLQVIIAGFLLTPLWVAGLWRLLRSDDARTWRSLAIAYLVLAIPLAILAGDKPYYVAALYLPLGAAGAVPFERWWARHARHVRRVLVPALLVALTLAGYPIVLPILPAPRLADVGLQEINYDLGEQIGWPTFVEQIEDAWAAIPEDERSTAIVLTGNYGEAGAIERYGRSLPTPFSGHNSWWWWGTPPASTTTVLSVGISEQNLSPFFEALELVGTLDNGLDVATEEQGLPIYVARGPRAPLPEVWAQLRHYN
jgi:hypothetical protein